MTFRERIGYIFMLLLLLILFFIAVKYSSSCLHQLNELLTKGKQVEAEVIQVEKKGQLYVPKLKFYLSNRSVEEYGAGLLYGDLYSTGDKINYIFYPGNPAYSRPKTFISLYGPLTLSIFICLFCLLLIIVIAAQLFSIPYLDNKIYIFLVMIFCLIAAGILGTIANFEIKRTRNLKKVGIHATAKVIRVDKVKRNKKIVEFPVFSFTDSNGVTREIRQNWNGLRGLKIGQSVEFIYNPDHITIGRRNGFLYLHGTSILFGTLSLIFLFGSIHSFRKLSG